jgi:hypothetical protein
MRHQLGQIPRTNNAPCAWVCHPAHYLWSMSCRDAEPPVLVSGYVVVNLTTGADSRRSPRPQIFFVRGRIVAPQAQTWGSKTVWKALADRALAAELAVVPAAFSLSVEAPGDARFFGQSSNPVTRLEACLVQTSSLGAGTRTVEVFFPRPSVSHLGHHVSGDQGPACRPFQLASLAPKCFLKPERPVPPAVQRL